LNPDDPRQELARFGFTPVIGAERKDIISGAQYFRASGETPDCIGVQITTGGPSVDEQVIRFKDGGDSESALMLQGLADRVAEDMADYLHEMQRELLGIPDTSAGTRWSPGYPGMADIANNRTILDLLDADNLAGIRITDAGEFIPTGTTGAVVSFHPSARYL
jgi:5-methyltetrahydrofolate--homocysteine methyltransferase